jgi:polyisoprenoid-binding protein YceI
MPLITLPRASCTAVHRACLLACAVGGCLLPAQAQNTRGAADVAYLIDPAHTRVHWEVMHFGTSTSRGRFDDIGGNLRLNETDGTGEVSITVHTSSVNTGVLPLDGVLRRSYLASDAHPQAYFVATGWRWQADAALELRGELTLNGVSHPLVLRAPLLRCQTHPQLQRRVCGADLRGELRRSDHGITDGLPFIGDAVRLVVQVEAIRDETR